MPAPNPSPLRLCVMQGDGIGPEITAATLEVLRAAGERWQIDFAFEDVKVLRHGLDRDREGLGELADGRLAGREPFEDRPPRRIPQRGEGRAQLINHMVE